MVPLNLTNLHCLQHSLFEHLLNLYLKCMTLFQPEAVGLHRGESTFHSSTHQRG